MFFSAWDGEIGGVAGETAEGLCGYSLSTAPQPSPQGAQQEKIRRGWMSLAISPIHGSGNEFPLPENVKRVFNFVIVVAGSRGFHRLPPAG